MFEKASRLKFRFPTARGHVSTEDLWDMSLPQLNVVAKDLNKNVKESKEEDFLEVKSDEDTLAKSQFDIVIHIMNVKKDEQKARLGAAAKKVERDKLLDILSRKQAGALESLSVEEIQKKLQELE